jgi:hypothetical protein
LFVTPLWKKRAAQIRKDPFHFASAPPTLKKRGERKYPFASHHPQCGGNAAALNCCRLFAQAEERGGVRLGNGHLII